MILTAHQPAYLPWLGLFHKISLADEFVLFDGVNYAPKDTQNRNRVKTPDGSIWLTVPIRRSGHRDKVIADMEINNDVNWRKKHWNAIRFNYAKAPYFSDYEDDLRGFYEREWTHLVDLNHEMLNWFLNQFGLTRPVRRASSMDLEGKKSDLVLDMCRKLGARVYIFGAMGRDYADVESFRQAGTEPVFQDYEHPKYPQLHGEFESHLSALDLLLNVGPDAGRVIVEKQRDPVPAEHRVVRAVQE